MSPFSHPNRSTNPRSTVPSAPNEQDNGYLTAGHHVTSQHMLQQVPVQQSSPIPIPRNNHPNIDQGRSQEHALAATQLYGRFPSYGLRPPPGYDAPSPDSMSNRRGSGANTSSGSSRGSSSSDIFHFSPPSSSEGHPTTVSSSRPTETGRFLYSPPPVDMTIQCNTCGDVIHTDELREHARRCNGHLRSPGSGRAVFRRRAPNANGYHSGNSQQGTWASSSQSQNAYTYGAGDSLASTSDGYPYTTNGDYTSGPQGGEMVPRAHHQADYSTPPFPPPPYF